MSTGATGRDHIELPAGASRRVDWTQLFAFPADRRQSALRGIG